MRWKYTRRTINGKRKRVKVHRRANGNELVRVVGRRNYRDATRPKGRRRIKRHWNYTDRRGVDHRR